MYRPPTRVGHDASIEHEVGKIKSGRRVSVNACRSPKDVAGYLALTKAATGVYDEQEIEKPEYGGNIVFEVVFLHRDENVDSVYAASYGNRCWKTLSSRYDATRFNNFREAATALAKDRLKIDVRKDA